MDHYSEQGNYASRRRLHCPHCRGEQLIAVSEATQAGGVATTSRVTRNASMTTYSTNTINRHYWMCRECGHKFRNLEDLTVELNKNEKTAKTGKKWVPILGIALVISMFSMIFTLLQGNFLGFLMFFVVLILCVAFGITLGLWLKSQSVVKKLTPEKAYLEQHCFN